jgi:hypothetical protein
MSTHNDAWGDILSRYSRAQAIADGTLIDVSARAREAGIRYPVALTSAVWGACVRVPEGTLYQDEAGRLWDLLCLLRAAARRADSDRVEFTARVVRRGDAACTPSPVRLWALCGPGDNGEPVVTVMLDGED